MEMDKSIEIIIGTYEEFLLGYKVEFKDDKYSLVQSFADKSHTAAIKCVAVFERWVVSGGADDRIFIYDMKTRRQSQILMSHEGTVNTLDFTPDGSHLLSGADDGRIIVSRLKTWFPEATWKKAHNGKAVTHIICHPSGKLAFSLGTDLILCTWNLAKGRIAYKKNLKSRSTLERQPDCLTLSPSGHNFTVCGPRIVEIWSLETGDVAHTHKTTSKPICLKWIANDVCLVGLENGKILWLYIGVDIEEKGEIPAHNGRVKAMCTFENYLATVSSSGEIKLWQILLKKTQLREMAATNIGCRPTCLNILNIQQFGENYFINQTVDEKKENESLSKHDSIKTPVKGAVTIEYENDDDDDDVEESENEKQGCQVGIKIMENAEDSNSESDDDDDDEEEEEEEESNESRDTENDADSVAEECLGNENDDAEDSEESNKSSEESDTNFKNLVIPPSSHKSSKHKLPLLKNKSPDIKRQKSR